MAPLDLVVRHARLREAPHSLVDIAIRDGRIVDIQPHISASAAQEIDAKGNLVTEAFVNPHLHLCKVYTFSMMDEAALHDYHTDDMGTAMRAIELAARVKERYDASWILENVRRALREAIQYGVTYIRAFADVDTKAGLEGVKALLAAREEFKERLHLEVVAFPQDGVVRDKGASDFVRQAMELGADVVGGIPWIEYTEDAARAHIEAMFAIAREFDAAVSMLVDDAGDPGLRTLEMLVVKTLEVGWHGRVLAHHARAMALYPRPYLQKIMALLKMARVGIVSDPHTGPLHAPVRTLLEENVTVCLGQDDISDAYYPYGRNNMLEVAFLASHLLWMTSRADMERLYDMITIDAARALGFTNYGLQPGKEASLVVLRHATVLDALRYHDAPAYTIFRGRVIAGGDDER